MILVVFSSAEDTLSNNVKKDTTFSSQGTENPSFFWDTRYIIMFRAPARFGHSHIFLIIYLFIANLYTE